MNQKWIGRGILALCLAAGELLAAPAAVRADAGDNWSDKFAGALNGPAYALAVDPDGFVYVGGNFTSAGGVSASYIARYNIAANTWSALGSGLDGTVKSLAWDDAHSTLYVGGEFITAGGLAEAGCIARWNQNTAAWSKLGSGLNNYVNALALDGNGNLYAGGVFTQTGDDAVSTSNVAVWNGSAWAPLCQGGACTDTPMSNNGTDGDVNALTWDAAGSRLYAGGQFERAGSQWTKNVAAWDPAAQAWNVLGGGLNDTVNILTAGTGGNLYAGGFFYEDSSNPYPLNKVARWNGSVWAAFCTDGECSNVLKVGITAGDQVNALSFDSVGNVFAAGTFTEAGGAPVNNLGRWDLRGGRLGVGGWSRMGDESTNGTNGAIYAMAMFDGVEGNEALDARLFVAGSFTSAGGKDALNISSFDGNPPAEITSLSPSSATVGLEAAPLLLTITGNNFLPGSWVRWGGVLMDEPVTYMDEHHLTVSLGTERLSQGGVHAVTVYNPAPKGGSLGSVNFTLYNPVPTLDSISPVKATAGGGAFTLTLNGSGFVDGSILKWGNSLETAFPDCSPGTVCTSASITIPSSFLLTPGLTPEVKVFNPSPGGGTSAANPFAILNPKPVLSGADPTQVYYGNSPLITLSGSKLVSSLQVWEGGAQVTGIATSGCAANTLCNSLQVQFPAGYLDTPGAHVINVRNPPDPVHGGGGMSAGQVVIVVVQNPYPTFDSIQPPHAPAGKSEVQLVLAGSGFVEGVHATQVCLGAPDAPSTCQPVDAADVDLLDADHLGVRLDGDWLHHARVWQVWLSNPMFGMEAVNTPALPFTVRHERYTPWVKK